MTSVRERLGKTYDDYWPYISEGIEFIRKEKDNLDTIGIYLEGNGFSITLHTYGGKVVRMSLKSGYTHTDFSFYLDTLEVVESAD